MMDAINQPANPTQNASGGRAEAGSLIEMPTLRTMEFAHHMRDLLTVVLGSLEQLRQQPLDEHGRHQLARAEVAVERATELLNRYSPLSDPGQQERRNAEGPQ
jgi:signal transduction histidine kinase